MALLRVSRNSIQAALKAPARRSPVKKVLLVRQKNTQDLMPKWSVPDKQQ